MAVQNFVFRGNLVGSKAVAGMKTNFLPFLTQSGPTFCPQKTPKKNSLNSVLVSNRSERQKSYFYQFGDFRTG